MWVRRTCGEPNEIKKITRVGVILPGGRLTLGTRVVKKKLSMSMMKTKPTALVMSSVLSADRIRNPHP